MVIANVNGKITAKMKLEYLIVNLREYKNHASTPTTAGFQSDAAHRTSMPWLPLWLLVPIVTIKPWRKYEITLNSFFVSKALDRSRKIPIENCLFSIAYIILFNRLKIANSLI